jgi:hypothetical protein
MPMSLSPTKEWHIGMSLPFSLLYYPLLIARQPMVDPMQLLEQMKQQQLQLETNEALVPETQVISAGETK